MMDVLSLYRPEKKQHRPLKMLPEKIFEEHKIKIFSLHFIDIINIESDIQLKNGSI